MKRFLLLLIGICVSTKIIAQNSELKVIKKGGITYTCYVDELGYPTKYEGPQWNKTANMETCVNIKEGKIVSYTVDGSRTPWNKYSTLRGKLHSFVTLKNDTIATVRSTWKSDDVKSAFWAERKNDRVYFWTYLNSTIQAVKSFGYFSENSKLIVNLATSNDGSCRDKSCIIVDNHLYSFKIWGILETVLGFNSVEDLLNDEEGYISIEKSDDLQILRVRAYSGKKEEFKNNIMSGAHNTAWGDPYSGDFAQIAPPYLFHNQLRNVNEDLSYNNLTIDPLFGLTDVKRISRVKKDKRPTEEASDVIIEKFKEKIAYASKENYFYIAKQDGSRLLVPKDKALENCGLKVKQDYDMEQKRREDFKTGDIGTIFPIIKKMMAADAYKWIEMETKL